MAVKNRLIVAVLRDDMPCDTAALKAEAHLAFLAVAREYELTAARLGEENTSVAAILDPEGRDSPEFEEARGPRIYLLLAAALRTAGGDYEQITGVVERARNDAWLEVGREIRSRRITANRSTLGSAQHESPRHQDLA